MNNKFTTKDFNAFFGAEQTLKGITINVPQNNILGIIGPAGSGKTTFLRSLNRLNDLVFDFRIEGTILFDGEDIYAQTFDTSTLRKKAGMVFALPVPLPMSIYDNLVYGPRLCGIKDRQRLNQLVEMSLKSAFLWDEVKDRLKISALKLSGGQQQRLCLARILALQPEVILLDEPCSGLDPISTGKIEEALFILKQQYTIILNTMLLLSKQQ